MGRLSYSEMMKLETFEERFRYLQLNGKVCESTFHGRRQLNQILYSDPFWKEIRRKVIIRDECCDLAIPDRMISGRVFVHHINPITIDDILDRRECVFDLNNLITVSKRTHDAIHYSNEEILHQGPVERKPNDTCPWKQ